MRLKPLEQWHLSSRLIVLSLVAVLACSGIGGWLLREQLHAVVLRGFAVSLNDRAEYLQAELNAYGLIAASGPRLEQGEFGRIFSGWYWVLCDRQQIIQSRSVWDSTLNVHEVLPWNVADGFLRLSDPRNKPLLGLHKTITIDDTPVELYVFGPLEETLAEWRRIDQVLLLSELVLILALMLWIIIQVRLGLSPLRLLQQRLLAIQNGQQEQLGQGFGPDLDPVAAAMDQVLQQNARIVDRAQHQAADLSHALKKPLAVLGIQSRNQHVSGSWLQEQVQAMSYTIDRHLARFGSGAGSTELIALPEILARLLAVMRQIHAERKLIWQLESAENLRWRGVTSDLEEMLGNLLDNAGKWAASRVEISVKQELDRICILIEDDGPGLALAQRQQALERGQRFDEQVEGHGLGLAIVQDIAETYGGELIMSASHLGGLMCQLQLNASFPAGAHQTKSAKSQKREK